MHRIKRDILIVAFIIVSLLFILVVMVWIPTSAAEASNKNSGLPTSTPTVPPASTPTIQPRPTEDATVTALQKEQLIRVPPRFVRKYGISSRFNAPIL
jgi:hypothetical protein